MNARARITGLLATLTALVLVAGVPAALVTFAGNPLPDSIPTLEAIRAALTAPDDGTLLLTVITWIAWIAWAVLTLAVLLEVAARIRGLHAPHLPGLALPQGAAAQLVSAAALLFVVIPPTAATAHATPAQPVPAVTAPVSPATATRATLPGWTPTAPPVNSSTPVGADVVEQRYTVRSGDSLSRIAATHLGDGDRWPELVDLNPALAEDPDLIFAGTVLRLPHTTASQGMREYTVRAGDTLSAIADRVYGDPTLYPLIVQASRHIPQPGGTYLSDPDVIDIGWHLNIPPRPQDIPPVQRVAPPAEGVAPPVQRVAPPAEGVAPPAEGVAPPVDNHAVPSTPAPSTPAPVDGRDTDQATPQGLNGTTSTRLVDRSAPEQTTSPRNPEGDASDAAASDVEGVADAEPAWLVLGLTGAGALLAGSMLGALRRRRRDMVRHRRPGRTLAPPATVLAPIEKTLTVVGARTEVNLGHLDQVLRRLAAAQTQAQVPMPSLAAVQLTETTIHLVLSVPADLPAPWRGSQDRHYWHIPSAVTLEEVGPDIEDQPAPWPLLTTVGMDEDGTHWLLNLEDRHIVITGDHTYGLDLARHVAAEAVCNPWAGHLYIDLVGVAPELSGLDPDRIHTHPDHDSSAGEVIGSCLLEAIAAVDRYRTYGRDTVTARVDLDEPDAWPTRLLVVDAATHSQSLESLLELIREHPGSTGTCVIVTDVTAPAAGSTTLQVNAQGRVEVPDLGLDLIAVGLTEQEAHGCAALLAHAEDPIDAAVPDTDEHAEGSAAFADQAGALRGEHTSPRHTGDRGDETATSSLLPHPDQHYLAVGATTTADLSTLAPRVPGDVLRGVEDADPTLDDDVAMWFHKDSALPKLALLGPVQLTARGTPPTKRRPYYSELLAFIALHPRGATTEEVCTAFNITPSKARQYVATLRAWLGTNPRTGALHLPDAREAPATRARGTSTYQVIDLLTDLDLFRRLRTRGQARGADGITDLSTALRLVQGRPFHYPLGPPASSGGWSWLIGGDRHDEHARVAIVDVAHIVTTRALADGDLKTARRAAETAILAAAEEEIPHLDLAAVAAAEGDQHEAKRILRDDVRNRTDDDGAPRDLPERTMQILGQRNRWSTVRAG
ncbi:LysM peptidoglycan-binding domain-containing protein [Nostocoides sp. F2B08]|uniref:LysM peptidoglycan-binding domain-containing protein n=1 Tax=Nostocoides sp. F2B08 TaxID=2653936 RepID=UPI0012636A9D|nr:LysM peptidoglycan-binding domain-containing protein [Tetrasphaera sp. F2B08]KAB7740052.1 LysM peptidoglycan-binding domain-containing protein [Tetrasphaera sp. F2B08]